MDEEEIVVGFEDEVQEIIHQLLDISSDLDIVSIIGMPGQGKTALAKKVYNHRSVKAGFYIRTRSCVSQQYRKRELLLDLLRQIVGEENSSRHGFHELNDNELGDVLFNSLYEERYLVVLDDIWDTEVWKDLRSCFPNNRNGSRVLLTSQMRSVALQAKPDTEPHVLRPLTDSESFELLQRKLFTNQDCPTEQIQNVLRQIAKNCMGLPLVVLACSSVLVTMEQERWEDFVESSSTIMSNSRILELSYEALRDHLKPCLLYFGSFLPGQEIAVSRLLWRWIGEGFVQQPANDDEKCLGDVAIDYLKDLIDRSLVMVVKKASNGAIKTIKMHELVHQFCVEKAKEENFLQVQNLEQEPDPSSEPNRLCIYSWKNLPPHSGHNLSSIIYFGNKGHGGLPLLSEFSHTKLLKVLDLKGFTCTSFPSEVEKLVQLRYLALSGQITSVPSTIVKLEYLETFLLKGLLAEIELPCTLLQLRKLKHLQVNNHVVLTLPEKKNLDQECPESSNMETFSTLLLSSRQEFLDDIIKKMPHIRKLKCTFLRYRYFGEGYQIPAMDFLSQLESLKVHSLSKVGYDLVFKFPSNLKKLTLSNFRLPWENLTRSISTLKNLEILKLLNKACEGESWDLESDQEEEFPNLKFLKLENLDIVRLNVSSNNFPRLQELVLNGCEKLEHISNDLAEVRGLKTAQVIMKCCSESVVEWTRYAEEIGVKVFMYTK